MKKINSLMSGIAAFAMMILFSQCAGQTGNQAVTDATVQGATDLKIAYIDTDTLLAKYNFCIDMNEAMVKKSENVRLTLNQKAKELDKQQREWQNKYQNGAFLSQERAEQELKRIAKLQTHLLADSALADLKKRVESVCLCSERCSFFSCHIYFILSMPACSCSAFIAPVT